mgnify:CR=1
MRAITQEQIKSAMERLNRDLDESSQLRSVLATSQWLRNSEKFQYKVSLRYRGVTYQRVIEQSIYTVLKP